LPHPTLVQSAILASSIRTEPLPCRSSRKRHAMSVIAEEESEGAFYSEGEQMGITHVTKTE
jgi:hypothetical protein